MTRIKGSNWIMWFAALLFAWSVASPAFAQKKPNILVIWGDDIGIHNISAYNHGIMGYKTPNIDRLAKEGALFTDFYAQQSCTAGRASFILGQHPFRTGLLTIGMPGSPHGIPDWTPTIADLLKQQGYATGQFGKNHLGDNNKHLPTVHGFDEFLRQPLPPERRRGAGKLLLPEGSGVQEEVRTARRAASRGRDTARVGSRRSRIPVRSPGSACLPSTRRSTPPTEFIDRAVKQDKPFFVWFNATRMHVWTHLKKSP